jgi:hypothetical protein
MLSRSTPATTTFRRHASDPVIEADPYARVLAELRGS